MAFAPSLLLSGVASSLIIVASMSRCSLASNPTSSGPIVSRTALTALRTPLPP
jgi:hypothetical protein